MVEAVWSLRCAGKLLTLLYVSVNMAGMTRPPMTRWTLDQLAERVGVALSVDYDGPPRGRVREVPDQRAIRYYTTIGLVDRPAAMRGRTALYVRRHLLQLVAIKRLQADGLSLARIQRELAGATDAQLERVARVPPLDEPAPAAPERAPAAASAPVDRSAFWKRAAPASLPGAAAAPTAARDAGSAAPTRRAAPAAAGEVPAGPPAATGAAGEVVALRGVRLGEGVTLLLEGAGPLEPDEVAAIRVAAGPLLEVVRRRRERS